MTRIPMKPRPTKLVGRGGPIVMLALFAGPRIYAAAQVERAKANGQCE